MAVHGEVANDRVAFVDIHLYSSFTSTPTYPLGRLCSTDLRQPETMRCLLFYAAFAAILSLFVAEAFTDCNAFKGSCPSNNGTTESHLTYDFTQASDVAKWITTTQAVTSGADGAQFVLKQHGDDPTLISDFYIFYGEVSVELKIAPGAGVVSTFFFMSDDGDEVDWVSIIKYLSVNISDKSEYPGSIGWIQR